MMDISAAIKAQKERKSVAYTPLALRNIKPKRNDYKKSLKTAHGDAIDLALDHLRQQRNSVPHDQRAGYQLAISRLEILRDNPTN